MHPDYLAPSILSDKRKIAVDTAQRMLSGIRFDCIAVRGTSGLGFGSALAYVMEKNIAVIRKSIKGCHSFNWVESPVDVKKFLIVDDVIDSGATMRAIIRKMKSNHPHAILIGAYLSYEKEYIDAKSLLVRINL